MGSFHSFALVFLCSSSGNHLGNISLLQGRGSNLAFCFSYQLEIGSAGDLEHEPEQLNLTENLG